MAPTPESEAFLAKKPKVPPTFDGVDYDDTQRLKQAQDAIIREQWVKSMMARLVRDELGKCYYREGVNHLEKCGALRGKLEWGWETIESCSICGCNIWIVLVSFIQLGWELMSFRAAERYFELLKEAKIRGYLFEQQNYVPKK